MQGEALQVLIERSINFFEVFKFELDDRVEKISSGKAVGASAPVSEYIAFNHLKNVIHVHEKLLGFQIFLEENKLNLQDNGKLNKILDKTHEYLLRAQNAAKEFYENSKNGAYYIPVKPHKDLEDGARKVLDQVNELLDDPLFTDCSHNSNKTWISSSMENIIYFLRARLIGYGLNTAKKHKVAQQDMNELLEHCLKRDAEMTLPLTKTSERFMEANTADYIPPDLGEKFNIFLNQYASHEARQDMTKESVIQQLTPEAGFPNPHKKITPN